MIFTTSILLLISLSSQTSLEPDNKMLYMSYANKYPTMDVWPYVCTGFQVQNGFSKMHLGLTYDFGLEYKTSSATHYHQLKFPNSYNTFAPGEKKYLVKGESYVHERGKLFLVLPGEMIDYLYPFCTMFTKKGEEPWSYTENCKSFREHSAKFSPYNQTGGANPFNPFNEYQERKHILQHFGNVMDKGVQLNTALKFSFYCKRYYNMDYGKLSEEDQVRIALNVEKILDGLDAFRDHYQDFGSDTSANPNSGNAAAVQAFYSWGSGEFRRLVEVLHPLSNPHRPLDEERTRKTRP